MDITLIVKTIDNHLKSMSDNENIHPPENKIEDRDIDSAKENSDNTKIDTEQEKKSDISQPNTESHSEEDTTIKELKDSYTEHPKKSQKKEKKNTIKIYLLTISILLFIILLVYLLYPRSYIHDTPLPYIFNTDFKRSLDTYFSLPARDEPLLVYGPSGCGKTRGLITYANELSNLGKLPFLFDFQTLSTKPTHDSISQFYSDAMHAAFIGLDRSNPPSAYKDDPINIQIIVDKIAPIVSTESQVEPQSADIKDPALKIIDSLFATLANHFTMAAFLECITILENSSNYISPSVFAIHLGNQPQHFSSQIFTSLIASPVKSPKIPIVFEISDQTVFIKYPEILQKSRRAYVSEFDIESNRKYFINNKIMNKQNYKLLSQNCGGHGLSFAIGHDQVSKGVSGNDALKLIKKKAEESIMRALYDDEFGSLTKNVKTLQKIFKNSQKIKDNKIVEGFLKKKIISLDPDGQIRFASKIIRNAAHDVLKAF